MTELPLLAWRVEIDSMNCVVFATSAAKARWQAVKGYWDAGYGSRRLWPRPIAKRAPHFDNSPRRAEKQRCWAEEWL